jgi:hypothetical protein
VGGNLHGDDDQLDVGVSGEARSIGECVDGREPLAGQRGALGPGGRNGHQPELAACLDGGHVGAPGPATFRVGADDPDADRYLRHPFPHNQPGHDVPLTG